MEVLLYMISYILPKNSLRSFKNNTKLKRQYVENWVCIYIYSGWHYFVINWITVMHSTWGSFWRFNQYRMWKQNYWQINHPIQGTHFWPTYAGYYKVFYSGNRTGMVEHDLKMDSLEHSGSHILYELCYNFAFWTKRASQSTAATYMFK